MFEMIICSLLFNCNIRIYRLENDRDIISNTADFFREIPDFSYINLLTLSVAFVNASSVTCKISIKNHYVSLYKPISINFKLLKQKYGENIFKHINKFIFSDVNYCLVCISLKLVSLHVFTFLLLGRNLF